MWMKIKRKLVKITKPIPKQLNAEGWNVVNIKLKKF